MHTEKIKVGLLKFPNFLHIRNLIESQHLCLSTQYDHTHLLRQPVLKSAPLLRLECYSKLLTCIFQAFFLSFSWLTKRQLNHLHQLLLALNFLLRLGHSSCFGLQCLAYRDNPFAQISTDSFIYLWIPSLLKLHEVRGLHFARRCGIVAIFPWWLFAFCPTTLVLCLLYSL